MNITKRIFLQLAYFFLLLLRDKFKQILNMSEFLGWKKNAEYCYSIFDTQKIILNIIFYLLASFWFFSQYKKVQHNFQKVRSAVIPVRQQQ